MKAEISLTSTGNGTVRLDGEDVSHGVKGFSLVSSVGNMPKLTLDLVVRDTVFDGQVLVDLPDHTRRVLMATGWTPPTN